MKNYNCIKIFVIIIVFSSCSFSDKRNYDLYSLANSHLNQDVLNKNYVGMTRRQIIYIFGKPILSDCFSDVYHYYLYNEDNKSGVYKEMLNLYFKNNKVYYFDIK